MKTIRAVDLFCGGGGTSTGLRHACRRLGAELQLTAINHWPVAIATHEQNHPDAIHLCADAETLNPEEAVKGGSLDLLVASPTCTHFSTARGGKPIEDQKRADPWQVVRWATHLRIKAMLVENVPEIRTWGPVHARTKRPIQSQKGVFFRAWIAAIEGLGYRVEWRILNAADYGDPTTRRRFFLQARLDRKRIVWPTATHSRTGVASLFGTTERWRPAREVIDWSVPSQSIFTRKKPLKPATMARILAGLERFGGAELQPFLVVLRNHADSRSLDQPTPAIAAQGQHLGLAQPFIIGAGGPRGQGTPKSIDAPLGTVLADDHRGIVEPVVMPVTHGRDGGRARPVSDPLPTVTSANRGELALVEPFILQQQSGGVPRSTDDPLPTIAADGAQALVEPYLVPFYGERDGQTPRTHSIDEPVPVIPASGDGKFGLVEPFVVAYHGEKNAPDGRAHPLTDPLPTLTTENRFGLVEPLIAKYYGTGRAVPVSQPMPTVTTKDRLGLVMPVVNGQALDIRFRMLQPHELAKAMSFPDGYAFAGNRCERVKQIGNAVAVETAAALCTAIVRELLGAKDRRSAWRGEATA